MKVQEAINVMQKYTEEPISKVVIEAHQMAIEALEKQIAKKPVIKPWSPALCPSCNCELSEDMGDGYYRHYIYLDRCLSSDCGQKLDWGEEDAE